MGSLLEDTTDLYAKAIRLTDGQSSPRLRAHLARYIATKEKEHGACGIALTNPAPPAHVVLFSFPNPRFRIFWVFGFCREFFLW